MNLTCSFADRLKPAMLVCHCNVITDKEITRIIRDFLAEDPWAIIVPAKVYKALEQRCKCSGCVPSVVDLITSVTAAYHREIAAAAAGASVPPPPAPPAQEARRRAR